MTEVLVLTGCAGFIGFNFLRYITVNDYHKKFDSIISIDKNGYASTYNSDEYFSICDDYNIISVVDNISNNNFKIPDLLEGDIVTVLDFAAESHVDNSIKRPAKIFLENCGIPVNLIDAIGMEKIKTYWHISTDEVYGDLPLDVQPQDWFTSDHQYAPSNPYSASKVAQDAYLASIAHTFKMDVRFIRMANQFGPHQHPEKMIPASIMRVLNGEPIKVYGNGKNLRQWTYVEDTVKCIWKLVDAGVSEKITHLADPKNLFDNNFIVSKLVDCLISKGYSPKIEYIEDRKGHDRAYALKVTSEVASSYGESFDESLERTLDFYRKGFDDGKYKSDTKK